MDDRAGAESHDDLMAEGRALRAAGRLIDARAKFDDAAASSAPGSRPFALARYHAGLVRQDLNDDAGAVAPLSEAVEIYAELPGEIESLARMDAALGLSLLRGRRWDDAARAFQESVDLLADRDEFASDCAAAYHNLAVALTRGGAPLRGLEVAREAIRFHVKVHGKSHPYTIESVLVEALALVEAGDLVSAAAVTRRSAAVILAGAGEAHPLFSDALLIEARRVAKGGDGGAAEALARRALFVLSGAGFERPVVAPREHDAVSIPALWRTAAGTRDTTDVAFWRVSIRYTLRRYQVSTLDFVDSGERPKDWYFFVPASWPVANALYAARLAFADVNVVLNAREPADASFLDAVQATAAASAVEELQAQDFAAGFRSRIWEPSIAYSVLRGNRSEPLSPAAFARLLAARGVPDAALAALGPDPAALATARNDPDGTIREVLMD